MLNGNWDALDDDSEMANGQGNGVEYVGVIEEESSVPMGSNGVSSTRPVRSTVRPGPSPYMRRRPVAAQPVPEPISDLKIATATGAVSINADAVRAAQMSPLQQMGDHAVRRASPGTYLVMRPTAEGQDQGMGTNGWTGVLPSSMFGGGEESSSGGGGFDFGGLVGSVLEAGADITGSILGYQQNREELRARAAAERAAREAAAEEARAGRLSESQQAQREFELQMERIRTLREAGREPEARELEQALPAIQSSGTSPAVWFLVAILGAGAIGAVIWGVTRKGDKE